ncbi:uncharacterized protein ARMOST_14359 [Armillaria ostoyae]|uniref:Uncharacterized protein n=1 Tax=Armillaria ostoyae TaxID=47428 RepID=A0A284RQD0_ARMOS|nr:uncharacterized protein ARMOST_14359 [Armillaria ostoyae]
MPLRTGMTTLHRNSWQAHSIVNANLVEQGLPVQDRESLLVDESSGGRRTRPMALKRSCLNAEIMRCISTLLQGKYPDVPQPAFLTISM